MAAKYNNATLNRPLGERPLDSTLLFADLKAHTMQIMEEEAWQKNDRNAITVFKSGTTTITLIALHKEATIDFGHANDILVMQLYIIEGALSITDASGEAELDKGNLVILHNEMAITGMAIEETICLLTTVIK